MNPLIGITASSKVIDYYGNQVNCHLLPHCYTRAVSGAGGAPLLLPSGEETDAAGYLDGLNGLVFSGGADISPQLYGEEPHEKTKAENPEQDRFEVMLLRGALRRDMPVLAICRGTQLLNVALGGTLIQDIKAQRGGIINHWQETAEHEPAHAVRIGEGKLKHHLGKEYLSVNSFHHQAIDRLGKGLAALAYSPDGIIEAVESEMHFWVLGVQWHPELMYEHSPEQRNLFKAFIQACKLKMSSKRQ